MPRFNAAFEADDDDIELLEVRHKRRMSETFSEPCPFSTSPGSQNQAAVSPSHSLREPIDPTHLKSLPPNNINEDTNATTKLHPDDEMMVDTIVDLTEDGYVTLPSPHQELSELDRTLEPEENIDRPYYNERTHCEGFVAWWDNRMGKGMILNYRHGLEHKVELKDIRQSNYGALIPGSMVEYEYFDDRFSSSKGFSKFWVVSGCEYVL